MGSQSGHGINGEQRELAKQDDDDDDEAQS